MISTTNIVIIIIIIILIIFFLYLNKDKFFNTFNNAPDAPDASDLLMSDESSDLDKNGFKKDEIDKLYPSYWYSIAPSEVRSKCFACDAESNYRHPSNCIDCEMKGGRPVDELLNRVLTR
jgi:hypothetical protein